MFASLSDGLQNVLRKLAGKARLSAKNIEDGIVEVRRALLQADVNYKVVAAFIDAVKKKAIGVETLKGVEPHQQFIKILYDELCALLGPVDHEIPKADPPPAVLMMVGLQGSGKTTTTAKLARLMSKRGRKPVMIAADMIRPAAVEQLRVLGRTHGIAVYSEDSGRVAKICERGIRYAAENGFDTAILDTQGRLHIDEAMMQELEEIKGRTRPHQIFLVADAMTGQDAVNSAEVFQKRLGLSGVILSKLDSDTRGGCALSIKSITGAPIRFVGTGEKIDDLEEFHPDRMASRILGMGDVVSLVEKAREVVDQKQAIEMRDKVLKAEFTFEDMLQQLQTVKKMGNLSKLVKLIPGMSQLMGDQEIDEKELIRTEALIQSMTPAERRSPELMNSPSRRRRVARGAGLSLHDINSFLKQFDQMRHLFRDLGRGRGEDFFKKMKQKGLI